MKDQIAEMIQATAIGAFIAAQVMLFSDIADDSLGFLFTVLMLGGAGLGGGIGALSGS